VIFLVNIGELFSKLFGKEFCLKKKEGFQFFFCERKVKERCFVEKKKKKKKKKKKRLCWDYLMVN
jgi:hypothetical protein